MSKVEIKKIQKGLYYEFYVEVTSMGIKSAGQKTAVSPVIRFNEDSFQILTLPDLEKEVPTVPYYAGSKDFTQERIMNLKVSKYLEYFETFPSVERILVNGKWIDHPISSLISELEVKFEPSKDLTEKINQMSFIEGGKFFSEVFCKHKPHIEKQLGYKLDIYSIPKRGVGETVYLSDASGISLASRIFNFGFANTFPVDRVTREIKSLRQAEMFLKPNHPVKVLSVIEPFVSFLRVAIVKTKERMLDGGDLFPSGQEKVACNLSKIEYNTDFTSLKDPDIVYKVNRGGIDIWKSILTDYNEQVHGVGPCRLVLPGGVKLCADPKDIQPYDNIGNIDLLIDFKTVADKGALGIFSMIDENSFGRVWTYNEALTIFQERKLQKFWYDGQELEGYICLIPVFRPRQRHTEICKPSTNTLDLISFAILNERMMANPKVEKDYQELRNFRDLLVEEYSRKSKLSYETESLV